ncbi:MAG TPA: anhydro-N-acetylmuramic acid kinase [Gemmatimonadaceae bacterium]|jgi:anhydro-N-acetylmuramic acid kinase|nr:anhydro-N-acetylmuramic acid kinase [Gemmatimonadaceae bacterium]
MNIFVGLMSGTSLDGISAAAVRFIGEASGTIETQLLAFEQVAYSAEQRERLLRAMRQPNARDLCRLSFDLGHWLAAAAVQVLAECGVPRRDVRAVGSHGQTLWHEPLHSTWQIGESAVIAERLGVDVVSDFRVRDVAAGGHGAPLVPIADARLFASARWRALQNIGGIGNVTIVPPNGAIAGVRAFDTGPGVVVIDATVRALVPEKAFDLDGALAAAGTPIESVVDAFLAHPYFASAPPKSTGRELFDAAYSEQLIARCLAARADSSAADIVATATMLTARTIADAYRRFVPEPVEEVLVSGGGARNPTLMSMLRRAIAPVRLKPFSEIYFDGEAKEAVAFAFLAHLHVNGATGNVPSATGARGPRILGKLTPC